jgi:hypothetical protein
MIPDRAFRIAASYSGTNPGKWFVWRDPKWFAEGEGFFVGQDERQIAREGGRVVKVYENGKETEDRLALEHDGHKWQWMDGD